MNIHDLTIKKFSEGLAQKKFSAQEIAKEFFKHIKKTDPEIGAYLSLNEESALHEAEALDFAIAEGEKVGPLAGVPIAVKDAILIKDLPATSASKILENYRASYDATVIQKLREEHALFLGKTNQDEFAMGSSTEFSAFKITKNPHDLTRVPGGSSGGSAAAVAAHMALGALGSDTGGSIRQPAGLCGVVGLKPTYGAVSRSGLIAMTSSLDQIGPITKTVEDAALLFNSIHGLDPLDATSALVEYPNLLSLNPKEAGKLMVGLPEEYFIEGIDDATRQALEFTIDKLKSLGVKFQKISLPHTKYALSCYYIIVPAEVSSNLARFDGIRYSRNSDSKAKGATLQELYINQRGEGFGPETKRRIMLGTFVLSSGYYDAYYEKAQKVRTLIRQDFEKAFKDVDVILTPVSPTPAFTIGEKVDDPVAMYLNDIFMVPVNLAGLPALSLPTKPYPYPDNKELPIGFQLIGKHFREEDILALGQLYEKA